MSITFIRLSAPSHIKEKLDAVLQETGKSINEIVNTALEKYLTDNYGLLTPKSEPDSFIAADGFDDDEKIENSSYTENKEVKEENET